MTKKQFENLIAKYGAKEVAENMVFSVKLSPKEQEESNKAFSAALAKHRAAMSPEEKLKAFLLQFRFQMEDYIKGTHFDKKKTFGYFLKSYIESLKRKHIEFANDIHWTTAMGIQASGLSGSWGK